MIDINVDNILFIIMSWFIVAEGIMLAIVNIQNAIKHRKHPWVFVEVLFAIIGLSWALFYGIVEITGRVYTVQMGAEFVRPGIVALLGLSIASTIWIRRKL